VSTDQGPGISVRRRTYTVVFNDLFVPGISARSWGIFCYLMSKPDKWEARAYHLVNEFKEGRDAIYASLNELVEAGLMIKSTHYDGNLRRQRYLLDEERIATGIEARRRRSRPDPDLPDPGATDTDHPDPGGPPQVNKDPVTTDLPTPDQDTPAADAAAETLPIMDGDGATEATAATVSKAVREPKVEAALEPARRVVKNYMDWWKKERGLPADLPIPGGDRAYNTLVGVRPKQRNCSYVTLALAQGYTDVQVKKALALWAAPPNGRPPSGLVPPPGVWTELLTAVAADRTPPSGRPVRAAAYSDQKWVDDPTGGWGPQPTAAGGQA